MATFPSQRGHVASPLSPSLSLQIYTFSQIQETRAFVERARADELDLVALSGLEEARQFTGGDCLKRGRKRGGGTHPITGKCHENAPGKCTIVFRR